MIAVATSLIQSFIDGNTKLIQNTNINCYGLLLLYKSAKHASCYGLFMSLSLSSELYPLLQIFTTMSVCTRLCMYVCVFEFYFLFLCNFGINRTN